MRAALARALRRPALHLVLGGLSAVALVWPFLTLTRPVDVLAWLFGAWIVITALLFVMGRWGAGGRRDEGDGAGDV